MKLRETSPKWEPELTIGRIEKCRIMLKVHGFLSDKENEKVKSRIAQRWKKETLAADDAGRGER